MRSLIFASSCLLLFGCVDEATTPRPEFEELGGLDRTPDPACSGAYVPAVTGQVIDQRGAPVAGAFPQMCVRTAGGSFNCLTPEPARDDGWFARIISDESRCMNELNFRVLLPRGPYGTTYCRSDLMLSDGIIEIDEPLVLYDVDAALELPEEGDAEMARMVRITEDLELMVQPAALFGLYGELGGARVEETTCFSEGLDLSALFVLTPEARAFRADEAGFPVRVRTDLAEGSVVELYVLGGLEEIELSSGETLREGEFEVFGTGTVRDGYVVSDEGSELPYLSWLGVGR